MRVESTEFSMIGKSRRPGGFTLVEVMVVVAIVSVLLSLLLPSLENAKESARTVECMNNLHQIAIAMNTYGTDEGYYPHCIDHITGMQTLTWPQSLGPYFEKSTVGNGRVYSNLSPVFLCPSRTIKKRTDSQSYSSHFRILPFYWTTAFAEPMTPFPFEERSGEIILVTDGCQSDLPIHNYSANPCIVAYDIDQTYDPSTAETVVDPGPNNDMWGMLGGAYIRFRHKNRANVLFVDGHVAQIANNDLREKNIKVTPPAGASPEW